MIRAAIVGWGDVAVVHDEAITAIEGAELVVLSTSTRTDGGTRSSGVASPHSRPWTSSWTR